MTVDEEAMELHRKLNGKISTEAKAKVKDRHDLSVTYTPGVAAPCRLIAKNPHEAYNYTIKPSSESVSPFSLISVLIFCIISSMLISSIFFTFQSHYYISNFQSWSNLATPTSCVLDTTSKLRAFL